MEIDKTTYEDLSVFNNEDEFSVFNRLDFTRTLHGRNRLRQYFTQPFSDLDRILSIQRIIKLFLDNKQRWPIAVTNGTIMVIEKFYETALDEIPDSYLASAWIYKIFHAPSLSMVTYSLEHFADFVRDMNKLVELFDIEGCPDLLRSFLKRAKKLLDHSEIRSLIERVPRLRFSIQQSVYYGGFIRKRFKEAVSELIDIYARMDAWFSMATAIQRHDLSFPSFLDQPQPTIVAESLQHILLDKPIAYNVRLNQENNFLFLTGANMAGKSTFIKAVGASVFLAHLGMGVPAKQMSLTVFDGILSNINVVDNIAKGESFFFNEVQRIKNTIIKINNSKKWLVLIDELFKGTNMEDAMKCSTTVIKGLIKIKNSLFILSTHLYEIGDELRTYSNISFKYFETTVKDDQLEFSYQLKDGISNDRLGYIILKREKVVDMLEQL
jgi:DNA mismatch repair protein MutS